MNVDCGTINRRLLGAIEDRDSDVEGPDVEVEDLATGPK